MSKEISTKEETKEPELKEWQIKLTSTNIQNLTYEEILRLNREKHKGTFMDRTWKEHAKNPLDDPTTTKWQKFKDGGYSVDNQLKRFSNNLMLN